MWRIVYPQYTENEAQINNKIDKIEYSKTHNPVCIILFRKYVSDKNIDSMHQHNSLLKH